MRNVLTKEVLADLCPKHIKGSVLDLGAGNLKYKPIIEKSATKYTSSDIIGDVDIIASADNLPVEDGTFDAITCVGMLEHCEFPHKIYDEMKRVLKTGGRALIIVPFMFPYHEDPFDLWRYSETNLKNISDMKVVDSGKYGGWIALLAHSMRMWLASPYKKPGRIKKELTRRFFNTLLFFDRFITPKDVYVMTYCVYEK